MLALTELLAKLSTCFVSLVFTLFTSIDNARGSSRDGTQKQSHWNLFICGKKIVLDQMQVKPAVSLHFFFSPVFSHFRKETARCEMGSRWMRGSNMILLQPAGEHPNRQLATVVVDLFGCFKTGMHFPSIAWAGFIAYVHNLMNLGWILLPEVESNDQQRGDTVLANSS